MLTPRALLLAAILLIIAVTPSVTDLVQAHQQSAPHLPLLWAWVALALIIALAYGEELTGGKL